MGERNGERLEGRDDILKGGKERVGREKIEGMGGWWREDQVARTFWMFLEGEKRVEVKLG